MIDISPDPLPLPPLREVIRTHGLDAIKALGQHFLLDTNLIDRIARTAEPLDGVTVIEIGPGPGGLTRALLAHEAREVIAIEKDRRCIAALDELRAATGGRLTILAEDALEIDAAALGAEPRRIVANLPYNISTVLLVRWLEQAEAFDRMVVMIQKEVADRLVAQPSTKAYGRLSVMTQWRWEAKIAFNVARTAFVPPPKVMSSVVVLTPRPAPLAQADWGKLEKVVAAAFNQRRKMLRSALKEWGFDFDSLGIPPTARAEELSVEQFCALARATR
jgi:16S rRNA (adenine1518-N6/adenine1519-N6)-dimethyltransferase